MQEKGGVLDISFQEVLVDKDMAQRHPDLKPALLCTGFSEQIDSDGSRALGIRGFLMKPFSIREMAAAIRKALGK
jgi:DNA-binding NarL/FixJ family response regulator